MNLTGDGGNAAARRVLVVDDEQDIRDLVTIWLNDDPRCATVTEAADVDTALLAARRATFDAILLDFFLGARLSVDILPELRRSQPEALLVIYTSSRRAATEAGVIAAGANLVLEKASVAIDDVIDTLLTAFPQSPCTPGPPAPQQVALKWAVVGQVSNEEAST